MFYAHSRPGRPESDWDRLEDHLRRTAKRAQDFLPQAPELAYLAGLWHDIGKYQIEFQNYLHISAEAPDEQKRGTIPHSIVGASLAIQKMDNALLAWAIAAHHSSLQSRNNVIKAIRQKGVPRLAACVHSIPSLLLETSRPPEVEYLENDSPGLTLLYVRMLLSALSDADMLDSEAWENGIERPSEYSPLCQLRDRLDTVMAENSERLAKRGLSDRPLNRMRREVLNACVQAAEMPTGQFTLTVPTGGGKTLSSLAFALNHACLKGLQRVIVVIPYTSIIEQTADVYRQVLGDENVVEHHSSVDPEKDTLANQRACENWDAPVIVTTSVQFFESLFAARKTRCRKLHNIANSVIVLDEVQTFPVDLLSPIRRVLGYLSHCFGATVVHCSATQTSPEDGSTIGPPVMPSPQPIIANPAAHFSVVRDRFQIVPEGSLDTPLSLEELAAKVNRFPSVMVIVHNRREAEQLAGMVDGAWHLSARMCAAHRKEVLDRIRSTLKQKQPCRLVATQLIEAGVDISFPVVFRALAGLETLAQAAGRCNRELDDGVLGQFHIFCAPSRPPSHSLQRGLAVARGFLNRADFTLDLNNPALFREYFREVLDKNRVNTDAPGIATSEDEMDFPEIEEKFRMIEDGQSLLAPYGDWKSRLSQLRFQGTNRQNLRALQRYFVQLYSKEIDELVSRGMIEPLYKGAERAWSVRAGAEYIYSNKFGFGWQSLRQPEPETLIG